MSTWNVSMFYFLTVSTLVRKSNNLWRKCLLQLCSNVKGRVKSKECVFMLSYNSLTPMLWSVFEIRVFKLQRNGVLDNEHTL